jgi:hypothetical protein
MEASKFSDAQRAFILKQGTANPLLVGVSHGGMPIAWRSIIDEA